MRLVIGVLAALLAFSSITLAQDKVGQLELACENTLSSHQQLVAELTTMKVDPLALCQCAAPIIIGSGLNRSDLANFIRSRQLSGAAIDVLLRINRSCVVH